MVSEWFPTSLTGFMQPPFNLVYKSKSKRALFTQGTSTAENMAERHSQSPPRIMRDDEALQGQDRLLQSIEASTQAMMAMMQHLIGKNRRNNHNNDQDDRSIAGSQHRTWFGIADRPTHPTFKIETPALTLGAMVTNIADELQKVRSEWDSLPTYV